jgi:hypothetical protein
MFIEDAVNQNGNKKRLKREGWNKTGEKKTDKGALGVGIYAVRKCN